MFVVAESAGAVLATLLFAWLLGMTDTEPVVAE